MNNFGLLTISPDICQWLEFGAHQPLDKKKG